MTERSSRIVPGIMIMLAGTILLLNNLDLFYVDPGLLVALCFLALAAFWLGRFLQKDSVRELVLAAVAGFIGITILIDSTHVIPEDFIGVLLFWIMASVFGYLFVRDQSRWWPLLPAGVTFTIGAMILMELIDVFPEEVLGSVFFFGLGLTFGTLYLLRTAQNSLDWAIFPAISCLGLGAFILMACTDWWVSRLLLPVGLIVAGICLIVRSRGNNLGTRP